MIENENIEQSEDLLRQEEANKIFGDEAFPIAEEITEEIEDDPWSSLPKVVKDEIDGLRSKVSSIEQMEYRLKQAESRVGGLSNELHAAKEAAKQVQEAPSQKQIESAADSDAEWNELKEVFPEWANLTESKMAVQRDEILSKIPDVDKLLNTFKESSATDITNFKQEVNEALVAIKHPNWTEEVKTPEFISWWEKQGNKDSESPLRAIEILDEYHEYKDSLPKPKDIIEERNKRLNVAQIRPTNTRTVQQKSEEDMSEEELRMAAAKKIWGR